MTAPEPTPLEAAAEAMHDQRCSGDGACDHGGRFEQLAALALTAGLAGDWLARVLDEHTSCKLAYRYGEDGSVSERLLTCGMPLPGAAGASSFRAAHQAAAIRATAGVGL